MNNNNNCNKEDYSMNDLTATLGKFEGGGGTRNTGDNISDEELFKQPPPREDCPICNLLLPTLESGSRVDTHKAVILFVRPELKLSSLENLTVN